MSRKPQRYLVAALLLVLSGVTLAVYASSGAPREQAGRVPVPALSLPAGEQCVEESDVMRRQHMHLLHREKEAAVRQGVRSPERGLQGCVDCHAGPATDYAGQPAGDVAFCASCHSYSAVRTDCFQCHDSRPSQSQHLHRLGARDAANWLARAHGQVDLTGAEHAEAAQ